MAADSVEREILIEASPEVVWGVITEPEQIRRWFSDEAEVEARPLRVLEIGIDAVTRDEADKARYLANHEQGWGRHLGEMRDYVASKMRGAAR